MKIEFIKRGAETRLILIFAGWSTDARYYSDCVAEGWDTAVVSDYRDLTMPSIPEQYTTVYIFAYSLGVAVASLCDLPAAVRIAICGSPVPVSGQYGIPENVYAGTLEGLDEKSLMKFHLRMAGDKASLESIMPRLPKNPDIELLKEELIAIRNFSIDHAEDAVRHNFDRVYIAEKDRIFSVANLQAYWEKAGSAEVVTLKASHAVDIAAIIKDCLPDTVAIGEGFARAGKSYNNNAVIQKEICKKMCDRLINCISGLKTGNVSLLEIGVGNGLLTEEWRKYVIPEKATYVDLTEMPAFGIAKEERYLNLDAERWFEETDEKFDIILSASTVQWFSNPIRFVSSVRSHLNPGGFAILSTFVKGNLNQLDGLRPCPIIYKSEEDYRNADEMETESWERTLEFDSVREMVMHLRLTGVSPRKVGDRPEGKDGKSPVNHLRLSGLSKALTFRPLILVIRN